MRAEIIVPAVMGCAMLWWIGRGLSLSVRFLAAAVTLGLVAAVVLFERVYQ